MQNSSILLKSIDSMIKMINGVVEVIEFQMTWLELKDYGGVSVDFSDKIGRPRIKIKNIVLKGWL